ncbi:protein ssuh2 like protein [Quercus suber]|uniref:Protein ssuh2 like protein n=1 Tax=Quercus suber TaxID=58331 RepID=A0AAW0K387_QUESU
MKTVLEIQRKNEEGIYEESRAKIPHSETIEKCSGCDGRGNIVCPTCNANQEPIFYKENQMTECPACYGRGLIAHKDGSDTKKTLSTRKVSATSGAASVPDEVFHRAKARAPVPPSSRVICERHTISVVPVTRVTMSHRNRSLISFYIIGFSREVYLKDYYPSRFCWGLCPYLEWLKL